MRLRILSKDEKGATIAEFAIVAGLFFTVIVGIFEFGRLLYTHQALTDAARRGARYAVLHKKLDEACVIQVVKYGETHIDKANGCAATGPALINNIEDANITVTYVGADTDGNGTVDTNYGANLGTVTVSIESYEFEFLIPYFEVQLNMPHYTTTLTAESAGEEPDPI